MVVHDDHYGSSFHGIGAVVVFSLVCSLFVALTLVPMLASRFLVLKKDKGGLSLIRRRVDAVLSGTGLPVSNTATRVLWASLSANACWSLERPLPLLSDPYICFGLSRWSWHLKTDANENPCDFANGPRNQCRCGP